MDNIKTTVKKINDCKREIELVIPPDEVMKEFDQAVKQFANRAKIKGFRPGKAPGHIVKQMYLPEIRESVVNSLAPKALNKELKEHNLIPIGNPIINKLTFEEGQPLEMTAQFEVWPEFELPDYKNIPVTEKKASVTQKEIDQALEDLRQKSAEYTPVEGREVKDEDYVIAEIKGKDNRTNKLLPTEKVVILSGHPENEQALNENLKGLKQDEQAEFVVKYDKDHANKKLAGKEIAYLLKVLSIKEKTFSEINDEFAKGLGEFSSLKDLKAEIKIQILAAKKDEIKGKMADDIIQTTSDRVSFDLPESVVEQEYLAIMQRFLSSQQSQSIKKEDVEKIKEEAKTKAQQKLKNHLILTKISEKENIEIKAEDIEEEIKAIAKANNMPLAQAKAQINKEGHRKEIEDRVRLKKTVDFLIKNAIIKK
ncbi:MAG: trigger factor [Candidatus Aminicenantes bacterium]|nr:trigger factor [Candidatus Aminicenantes bacterium]